MRIDLYTKIILTIIALTLALVECKSVIQPNGVAAGGLLASVQFSSTLVGFRAFDAQTGDVWDYSFEDPEGCEHNKPNIRFLGQITQLGKPLVTGGDLP